MASLATSWTLVSSPLGTMLVFKPSHVPHCHKGIGGSRDTQCPACYYDHLSEALERMGQEQEEKAEKKRTATVRKPRQKGDNRGEGQ